MKKLLLLLLFPSLVWCQNPGTIPAENKNVYFPNSNVWVDGTLTAEDDFICNGDDIIFSDNGFEIKGATDDMYMSIKGGTTSSGAYLQLSGPSEATEPGKAVLASASGSNVVLRTGGNADSVQFLHAGGAGFRFENTTMYGDAGDLNLELGTEVGSDTGSIGIVPSGYCLSERGAAIHLYGADHITSASRIDLRAGDGGLIDLAWSDKNSTTRFRQVDADGTQIDIKAEEETVTIGVGQGAAGVNTSTNVIPPGVIMGVGVRIQDAPGGGCTELDVGITGGDTNRFINNMSVDLGDSARWPGDGDGTATLFIHDAAATTAVLTCDANVTDDAMIVKVIVYYWDVSVPLL